MRNHNESSILPRVSADKKAYLLSQLNTADNTEAKAALIEYNLEPVFNKSQES